MEPVFLDFHIHTSENPENLNENYDVAALKRGIDRICNGADCLVSISDHNVINKSAYMAAKAHFDNLLLGVELHVRNFPNAHPYHCHILFNLDEISDEVIDAVNERLDLLYPNKRVRHDDPSIPSIETIANTFDEFDFLLLPHGGQNHSTFDRSIPEGVQFDRTLERSIYYNHFEGFTARNNAGLERTHEYFERLGIRDFVNLVTATDNYVPAEYPDCRAGREAFEFVPTWMLAMPTFEGLRLSLSESSRLVYGDKPDTWAEYIRSVRLNNAHTDIDVTLTPGLNVVIGGSSSGKSLFVDSLVNKINGSFEDSPYVDTVYEVEKIEVDNPTGQHPHYLNQNFIVRICDPKYFDNRLEDIPILKNIFPSDVQEREQIANGLTQLRKHVKKMLEAAKTIEDLQEQLVKIPNLAHLITQVVPLANPVQSMVPEENVYKPMTYSQAELERHTETLDEIDELLTANPLLIHDPELVPKLKAEVVSAREGAKLEARIRSAISSAKTQIDAAMEAENKELATKRRHFDQLIRLGKEYASATKSFYEARQTISEFSVKVETKEIASMGHQLFISNNFELTKEKVVDVINGALTQKYCIGSFDNLRPEALFQARFKRRDPKIKDYVEMENYVCSKFADMNSKTYKITTNEGRDFDALSAGWKTSVILDLVLGWDGDNAPLVIDQPEDNLASSYMNRGLVKAIKECKSKRQIILVSHNATIPMLGDAQNVIYCRNEDQMIVIRSNLLECDIDGKKVIDLIAELTDGGKTAIKKRVKKYNLKSFRGADEVNV
ncbi:MAG: hypothetical protein V2I66_01620 [Halieaceae bacterium]|jgi:hypothetical protein|nr:hypothetical protein [Halieaceae bacterium]